MGEQAAPELTTAEAAALIGINAFTLHRWRPQGRGPAFYRIGKTVKYRREDVLAWIRRQRSDGVA